jgi:hypothetical protein
MPSDSDSKSIKDLLKSTYFHLGFKKAEATPMMMAYTG